MNYFIQMMKYDIAAEFECWSFRLLVVSPTGGFAYTEVDSPTQVKSIPLHK